MGVPFSRSLRSLDAESTRPAFILGALGLAVLAGWIAWFFLASIPLYAETRSARLEAVGGARPVTAAIAGVVVAVHTRIGLSVDSGASLLELDATAARDRATEARARLAGMERQLVTMRQELTMRERAAAAGKDAANAGIAEAEERLREAEAAARYADENTLLTQRLRAQGFASDLDESRETATAEQRRAAANGARRALVRLRAELARDGSDRGARVEELRRAIHVLEGERHAGAAALHRFEDELGRHVVAATISGHVGEVSAVQPGDFVQAGTRVATLVPHGELRVVAFFVPEVALGYLQAGQKARLRLEALPWPRNRAIDATVARVATEPRDGVVRVECLVATSTWPGTPPDHGLPGVLAIEYARASPAELLLRETGRRFRGRNVASVAPAR